MLEDREGSSNEFSSKNSKLTHPQAKEMCEIIAGGVG